MKYSISAVIIARNEESTIKKVIIESLDILPKLTKDWEILINDDASEDKTGHVLDFYSKRFPRIKVFHQKKPLGISGGFEFLYKKANKQLVFINAADGQYSIKDLPKMINEIDIGYDLVIGKRSNKIYYGILRKFISFIYNKLPEELFGVKLYDAGSIKLYKKEVLRKTVPFSKSVFSEAERIIRAQKLGFKITSISIRYFARKKGSSSVKFKIILDSIFDMLRVYFSLKN